MPRVPLIVSWNGITPRIASDAFVAQNATLVGDVTMARESSAYFGSVLRGDRESITVGPGTNIQDNVTVHAEINAPVVLGANVSVGHNAVVHGCVVEDGCLLGMGSAVLNGARIGTGSLVAAGTVVLEGIVVPPGCLVAGGCLGRSDGNSRLRNSSSCARTLRSTVL